MTVDGDVREGAADSPITEAEAAALFGALSEVPALLLAVSGGPDSTALMWLAARWRDRLEHPPRLIAVTVDHGLRKESVREALAVKRLARNLKVPHRTLRWTGRKPKTGIQEAARAARYRLLAQAARAFGAREVLTAHTLDDQAETILFRMARGSGLRGLAAMWPSSGLPGIPCPPEGEGTVLVRPLLGVPKARLIATMRREGVAYVDDPTNHDPRFARPRLRAVMSALAREGLSMQRLALLARRVQRAENALDHAVELAAGELAPVIASRHGTIALPLEQYDRLPEEVALRLLGRAIDQTGDEGPVELGKLETLYEALKAARAGAVRFRRTLAGAMITVSGGKLVVERAPSRRTGGKKRASGPKAPFTKPR